MHKHVISIDIYLYFNYCNHKSTTLIKFKLSTTEQKKLAYTGAKYRTAQNFRGLYIS